MGKMAVRTVREAAWDGKLQRACAMHSSTQARSFRTRKFLFMSPCPHQDTYTSLQPGQMAPVYYCQQRKLRHAGKERFTRGIPCKAVWSNPCHQRLAGRFCRSSSHHLDALFVRAPCCSSGAWFCLSAVQAQHVYARGQGFNGPCRSKPVLQGILRLCQPLTDKGQFLRAQCCQCQIQRKSITRY